MKLSVTCILCDKDVWVCTYRIHKFVVCMYTTHTSRPHMHCFEPFPPFFLPQISLEVTLECKSDNLLAVLFTLLALKSIYLWVGLFLAFENRRVNIPALDDSKYIAASVYCSFVTCIPLVPIGALDVVHRDIRYGIIAGGLLFANTIILALLFIPRVGHGCMHAQTCIILQMDPQQTLHNLCIYIL